MGRYSIEFAKSVRKDLKKIANRDVKRILKAVQRLAADPRPSSSKKLVGEELYRIRVGVYRVIYEIHDGRLVIVIVKAGHRKGIHRN
ncbi:MAG TPA: type II toxin-antitoxin system RelE/ParE family toxin [Verrucomicrobiales bacterium]|jgi:mRNA interferase RelE/StbE|nr:type II toxin-antitoxin system RelE/ParE family toxin [Verrucomicrobiales bacterium]HIL69342.1 type II toxin-antitoxin system RelE/ParE family toxin [Verrucomicrobiota bacterium]